jgi:hypothetical protein
VCAPYMHSLIESVLDKVLVNCNLVRREKLSLALSFWESGRCLLCLLMLHNKVETGNSEREDTE